MRDDHMLFVATMIVLVIAVDAVGVRELRRLVKSGEMEPDEGAEAAWFLFGSNVVAILIVTTAIVFRAPGDVARVLESNQCS